MACALALAGCDEELDTPVDAGEEPIEWEDAGKLTPHADAGQAHVPSADAGAESDASAHYGSSDAGAAQDAAVVHDGATQDASVGSDATLPRQDAGASADAGTAQTDAGNTQTDAGANQGTHFFLPTGEPTNTSAPRVEVDSAGNVHSVYPAYAGGNAFYSLCESGSCTGSASAKVVHFQVDASVSNTMLALTQDGKPRILISTYMQVYWGACDQNCGERANWTFASILNHGSKRQVSGEALALDKQGRPRFLMHTYRALFGIGQEAPEQIYAQCDASCEQADSWRYTVVAPEIWEGSHLRFDAQGRAHVATTVVPFEGNVPKTPITAYLRCDAAECGAQDAFRGIGEGYRYRGGKRA